MNKYSLPLYRLIQVAFSICCAIWFVFFYSRATNGFYADYWLMQYAVFTCCFVTMPLFAGICEKNPLAKFSITEVHDAMQRSGHFIPKSIAKKLHNTQGFIYRWQIEKYSIDRNKIEAKIFYGITE